MSKPDLSVRRAPRMGAANEGPMNTLSIIEVLNGMLTECEERFSAAESAAQSPQLKAVLRECASEREQFQGELRSLAEPMCGTTSYERFDVCFPAPLAGHAQSPLGILDDCERTDAAAIVFYEKALCQRGNSDHAIDVIHKQYRKIRDSYERM